MKRVVLLTPAVCLIAIPLLAASSPFVADWKLDSKKTRLFDSMKVEHVAGDTYVFDFAGTPETIAVDGKDHPGLAGTTLSVTPEGPNAWKVVRRKDGRMLLTANWMIAKDGSSLRDELHWDRIGGGPHDHQLRVQTSRGRFGLRGNVDRHERGHGLVSRTARMDSRSSIRRSKSREISRSMAPSIQMPARPSRLTATARRIDDRTLEIIDKYKGKAIETEQLELSPVGKTLTVTQQTPGAHQPNILVFERQQDIDAAGTE